MILCDTNILIELYKANPKVIQPLQAIGSSNIAVSVITQAELLYGAKDKQELNQLIQHLSHCTNYAVNENISALFIQLMTRYSLSHKTSIPDMLIAATAITQNIQLYTLNIKDFKFIPELTLYIP